MILFLFLDIGAMLLIRNPLTIEKQMDNNSMPILTVMNAAILVQPNIEIPIVPITDQAGIMSMFHQKTTINLMRLNTFNNPCQGNLCGAQRVFANGVVKRDECGCYQRRRAASVGFVLQLKVICEGGDSFTVSEFVDTKFEETFILEDRVPGISASMIDNKFDLMDLLEGNVGRVFDHVNTNGSWSVVGWVKPAESLIQEDRGNNPGYNQPAGRGIGNESTKHIVRLLPFEPQSIDEAYLAGLKINLREEFGGN